MSGGLSRRRVEPEILDDLSEADPRAVASRRDLRRVNALMLHRGIMTNLLRESLPCRRYHRRGQESSQHRCKKVYRMRKLP